MIRVASTMPCTIFSQIERCPAQESARVTNNAGGTGENSVGSPFAASETVTPVPSSTACWM